ncbi:MAG: hypothetical protein DMG70_12940 [Acidobacteria bacterium]|nr:MAG: hypothetical protein DMG70_12940 [Acidobacteriota bacterium]
MPCFNRTIWLALTASRFPYTADLGNVSEFAVPIVMKRQITSGRQPARPHMTGMPFHWQYPPEPGAGILLTRDRRAQK